MAKLWTAFFPYVQPSVPGCPESTMTDHIRWASQKFCAQSEVWRSSLGTEHTAANLAEYELFVPTGALLENVHQVFVAGRPIPCGTDIDTLVDPDAENGAPLWYSHWRDHSIRLYPTPDQQYTVTVDCVLKPSLTATSVEDFIFDSHAHTIACGAMASLMLLPNKEWTNPDLGAYHNNMFLKEMDRAKGRDMQRANRRVKGRPFA